MARPEHLYVFCYDISKDSLRRRVAERLEDCMVRVQGSVFEGRLTRAAAERLASETAALIDAGDSLRAYAITAAGRRGCFVHGPGALMEDTGYWLL